MQTNRSRLGRLGGLDEHEGGFGVIEVVVSMFLVAILGLSFIPILITTWKTAALNTTIATATQIVNQQIEGARAVRSATATIPACQDVSKYLTVTLPSVIDPRGVTLQPQWDPATCPSTYPGVVRARVTVTRSGSAAPIASAVTLIYVGSAS